MSERQKQSQTADLTSSLPALAPSPSPLPLPSIADSASSTVSSSASSSASRSKLSSSNSLESKARRKKRGASSKAVAAVLADDALPLETKSESTVWKDEWRTDDFEVTNTDPEMEFCQLPEELAGLRTFIRTHEEAADAIFDLDVLQCRHIIVYDGSLELIRHLELAQVARPHSQLQIFYLVYEDSAEEQRLLNAVNREKDAFEVK